MKLTETITLDHPLIYSKEKKYMKLNPSSNTVKEDEDTNITSNGKDTRSPKQHGNLKRLSHQMATWSKNIDHVTIYNHKHCQTETFIYLRQWKTYFEKPDRLSPSDLETCIGQNRLRTYHHIPNTPLDRFMAAVDKRNATYLLFRQLPYAV